MYFTICIPAYNRANTIGRTLESLAKQSFDDFEILVVDDGSKDNTKDIVKSWSGKQSCKYIYKENGGKHTALNVGIENAQGLFFIILDSDDWLVENALEIFHAMCEKIVDDDKYSGVLARCMNNKTKQMIGDIIPDENMVMSYVDFHFSVGYKYDLGDCCECNKTLILKQYRFPERPGMKFVPEAWMFDQIGVKYKLFCSNKIVKVVEYLDGGITSDKDYKNKNNIGYLYHYISRIENVLPNIDAPLKFHVIAWWRYWQAVRINKSGDGPRLKKVTPFGYLIRFVVPVMDKVYKVRYRKNYEAGR